MPRVKIVDLWQSKPGGKSIANGFGNVGGIKIRCVLMPNNFKKGPKDPDYQLWSYGPVDEYFKDSQAQSASAPAGFGTPPQQGFPNQAPAQNAPNGFGGKPQPPAQAAQSGPEIGPDGYPTAWDDEG